MQDNQINSFSQNLGQSQAPNISSDLEKQMFQELTNEFMNNSEMQKRIKQLIGRGNRLNVNIDEVRHFNDKLSQYIIKNPIEAIKMFEDQLSQAIKLIKDDQDQKQNNEKIQSRSGTDIHFPKKTQAYYVNFEGNIGKNYVTPRGLKANLVNKFVQVQGIVTKMTMVNPKLQTSVHFCEATKKGLVKHYQDEHNLAQQAEGQTTGETSQVFPTKDPNDNPLTTEYGYCLYKDSQVVTIQEMPENAPAGQLPRSVQVILENDLVNRVKPGDRVQVSGVFRVQHEKLSGTFKSVLVATGVESLLAEKQKPSMSEQDIKSIRKLAKDKDIFNILGESIAPSIEGHLNVKKSILLQLLGGAEKVLENGTHLRGDINILMVGDPSTAKSQLLRHIMDIAPLAINTTGRGSSGVGLTAAVAVDSETGERHLEAGAMVLADRGTVCIDEFDKMNDGDRVAIHEVMEQQTVTIAKAGIHTTLNARCSVVAAANPIYSEYARDQSVGKNIGLPDSLLSRFDLLFIMLDEKEADSDRRIAERVIMNHRYQNPNADHMQHFNYSNNDYVIEVDMKNDKSDAKGGNGQVYEKNLTKTSKGVTRNVVTRDFLKKYLSFVKSQKSPEIDKDCINYAAEVYAVIRQKAAYFDQNKVSSPVTVRTLETIIRLATAYSKLRMSKTVTPSDIDVAVNLIHLSIFGTEMVDDDEAAEREQEEEEILIGQKSQKNTAKKVSPVKQKDSSKKQAKFDDNMNDESDHENDDGEFKANLSGLTNRNISTRRSGAIKVPDHFDGSKKKKIDDNDDVNQLFQAQPISQSTFDQSIKKFVYRMISTIKKSQNNNSNVGIGSIWTEYQKMSNEDKMNKISKKAYLKDEKELRQVIEQMEADDLLIKTNESVVLMND